jgi:beta-galactosidase
LEEVELFVNDKSIGRQKVPHLGHVEWKARYEPGSIEARGSKDGKVILSERRETSGPAVSIRLTSDRNEINADGEDVAILRVEAFDVEGRPVPTADRMVAFTISGPGKIIGVGNGDPNCQESDKEPKRSLFNGLAQVIVQSTKTPGEIQVDAGIGEAQRSGRTPAKLVLTSKRVESRPSVPDIQR